MRAKAVLIILVGLLLSIPTLSPAAIDRLQKEDGARLAVGLLRLYYNIGKSCLVFAKTLVVSAPNLPKGIATDIFHIQPEGAPSAYYMTKEEKKEREKQKRLEKRLEKELELEEEKEKDGLTKIR